MSVIAFTKVAYPYGWLGNMAPFPIVHRGEHYRTTEALFQCLRFPGDDRVQKGIRALKSPMGAKMRAKRFRHRCTVGIRDKADLKRMELCLRLKCKQHPQLRDWLVNTGKAELIEDCTARPKDIEIDGLPHASGLPFWGAALDRISNQWRGANALGVLWMQLRSELQSTMSKVPPTPKTFIGSQFDPEPTHTMKALQDQATALKSALAEVEKLAATNEKIEAVLKEAGYSSLKDFMAKLPQSDKPAKAETTRAPKAKKGKKAKKGAKARITDEQLKQMKELRDKNVSQAKVAEQLGVSIGSVLGWQKKKFKR